MSGLPLSILFVPGLWEGPSVYASVAQVLQETDNLRTSSVSLISTGQQAPNDLGFKDDVQIIRAYLELLVERGHRVILVLHSAGGFLGRSAAKGFTEKERNASGKTGGVARIIYVAAALVQAPGTPYEIPFVEAKDGRFICKNPKEILFSDMSLEVAARWMAGLQCQPNSIDFASAPINSDLEKLPSSYLICENDQILPEVLQRKWAQELEADIETCDAGHMVMLSQPEKVVEVIRKAVKIVAERHI
ncbi:alpha/beta-hydrolase [Viridothelium virens]|uniref:Alpha/beta-hydrolase n=1 Tax=Viridothelium virens TaxID=1048519 RepID=A0A6A6H6G3_VIRVR|nr:alpha/beta-hydrolase [Viridothelium virens]